MPGTISPRHIVEAVLDGYLTAESGLAGVAVYTGDNAEINVLPKCVVLCDSARTPPELPEGAGNYMCSVRVTLFSNADDTTLSAHRARCAALAGAMGNVTAVKAAFATDASALCYDVIPDSEDEGRDERSWATVLSYTVPVVVNPTP
jgi:hypothetical protein